jgi:hypothetical protein
MKQFVFVGSYCEIDNGRIKLEKFGQRFELEEAKAAVVIAGGGAIVAASDFDKIGFDPKDLQRYAFPGPRENAPSEFKEKFSQALKLYLDSLEPKPSAPAKSETKVKEANNA